MIIYNSILFFRRRKGGKFFIFFNWSQVSHLRVIPCLSRRRRRTSKLMEWRLWHLMLILLFNHFLAWKFMNFSSLISRYLLFMSISSHWVFTFILWVYVVLWFIILIMLRFILTIILRRFLWFFWILIIWLHFFVRFNCFKFLFQFLFSA